MDTEPDVGCFIVCDRDGCVTHASADLALKAGFLYVVRDESAADVYCSVDCALIALAQSEPMTTIGDDL